MGNCIYCGASAGLFKNKHHSCETNYNSGRDLIISNIRTALPKTSDFQNLKNDIQVLAGQYAIKSQELASLYTKGFNDAIDTILEEGVLTREEEANFERFKSCFGIDKSSLDKNNSLQKVAVLRGVMEGKIPECKIQMQGYFPFRLLKSEVRVWIFNRVNFYEQHTGITWSHEDENTPKNYYTSTSFKGCPVNVQEMKRICQGTLTLTNRQIYFSSSFKNFTIPYNKVSATDSYEDAVGILVHKMSATPFVFKDLDGWFVYNLITNLKSQCSVK